MINNKTKIATVLFFALYFTGSHSQTKVSVTNTLNIKRTEIAEIPASDLKSVLALHPEKKIRIKSETTNELVPIQWIDYNSDGKPDALLFEASVNASATAIYTVVTTDSIISTPKRVAYSRFVPERSDDYTWENDKIAFRVYGPKGQQEALKKVAGSTLSSGVDIWFKKVDYSIIDKWYQMHTETPGYYHTDHGEGYDPYHVGNSRGTGGIGLWLNDSLHVSKNYISHKTIANGPLRTVFELEYAPWSDYKIKETKRISLDVGSNFTKFEISHTAIQPIPNLAIGISLHKNEGKTSINLKNGWFRHWETIDKLSVGQGIVIDPRQVVDAFAKVSKTVDQSNLLVITKPANQLTYYAGFAWQGSRQVGNNVAEWDAMLGRQALIIANPLKISISSN